MTTFLAISSEPLIRFHILLLTQFQSGRWSEQRYMRIHCKHIHLEIGIVGNSDVRFSDFHGFDQILYVNYLTRLCIQTSALNFLHVNLDNR